MTTRKANIVKLDAEINALATQRKALEALADAALLNDFMIALCEDPAKVEAYKKNPEAFAKSAGLPEHLIGLVVSGGRYAFRFRAGGRLLKTEEDGGETVVVVVIIVVVVILP
jgi:hypothetical protein